MRRSTYDCPVSRTPAAENGPVRDQPDLAAFANWVSRVLDYLKEERGWSVRRVARESGTPRSAIYRWADPKNDAPPTRRAVERFAENVGVAHDEPFAILGWSKPATPPPAPMTKVENPRLVEIQRILDDHELSRDDVLMIESLLKTIEDRYGNRPTGHDQ